jgi:hypothetical protein
MDDVKKRKFCQIFSVYKVLSRAVLSGILSVLQMGIKPSSPQRKKNRTTWEAGKAKQTFQILCGYRF